MATDVQIRDTVLPDVEYIAARMRAADRIEVEALSGMSPQQVLMQGFRGSDICLTGTVDDEPCCMFGFSGQSMLSDSGTPWLLGTDLIHAIPVQFLRKSREIVDSIWESGAYDKLENWIDSENEASLRWLPWLGFTVNKHETLERRGRVFYRFIKK